jgi:hydrogenase expression/formation protein HypD
MGDYINEFRNSKTAAKMTGILAGYKGRPVKIMEVCGTHTMSIFRYGIRGLLPAGIELISGPGCPVCVTPGYYINSAIKLCQREDVIIATFGDMMKVPGNESSLLMEKARGMDIRVVYSPLDSLKLAAENPAKKVVFLSIGFETTTPIIALSVLAAKDEGLTNFYVLTANKTIPEALKALTTDTEIGLDGYLYPGNVSTIIGTSFYEELSEKYHIPGVVAGFEPLDILGAIIALAENINKNKKSVDNHYSRVVNRSGNPIALEKMYSVFEPSDAVWRGIGAIPRSGLKIRSEFSKFDAWEAFDLSINNLEEPKGCLCGEILKGKKNPKECGLFNKLCTPENPIGACMVSSEGTCAAYYKYGQ